MTELLDVQRLLNVQVRRLSLGERMKMEIIAALLHHPSVLFLDEPTIGLDVISQKNIRNFLKQYNKEEGVTILLTSHYMDDINDMCKRSIVINHGQVIYNDHTEKIGQLIGNKKRIKFKVNDSHCNNFSAYGVVKEKNENDVVLEVESTSIQEIIKELIANYALLDFTVENLPIEEGIELLYQS